ncbi:hypothetical protein HWV62_37801 [Athelia sp. TMB]|nr:hypothetical protein HWV62_37801 [Athelia sp. TMB]
MLLKRRHHLIDLGTMPEGTSSKSEIHTLNSSGAPPSLLDAIPEPAQADSDDPNMGEALHTLVNQSLPVEEPSRPLAEPPVNGPLQDSPVLRRSGRSGRQLPIRFRVPLPQALPPAISAAPEVEALDDNQAVSGAESSMLPPVRRIQQHFVTPRNVFGLFRRYFSHHSPTHDPERDLELQDLTEGPLDLLAEAIGNVTIQTAQVASGSSAPASEIRRASSSFFPYPNESMFRLGDWYWNGTQKSQEAFNSLISILKSPSFMLADVCGAPRAWSQINTILSSDGGAEDGFEWEDEVAGWKCKPIIIKVPFHQRAESPGPKPYIAGHLYHRSLVAVIREKLSDPFHAAGFHYEPFELFWQPRDVNSKTRVHGELYTSPAFLRAYQELLESPGEPNCSLPRILVAMMFWSDATQLTSFGNAKLWPCYLFFGNESKYRRCKPSCHLCSHVAYFEALPDSFKDFASEHLGSKGISQKLMTHCRRELFHAQWEILLDDEFLHAYQHGIVIQCSDGVTRRFYPRILTYSADYPEKLGTLKDMKERKSLIRADNQMQRQKVADARNHIYNKNLVVDSEAVEKILKEESLVPTENAFLKRLGPFGFSILRALLVDLMHEFELGVWRAIFIHLIRILEAHDKTLVAEMDRRFRLVPAFGRDTIRRFSSNVSELKKLAARDYEDILQCSIAVFDGLLPEPHNTAITKLIFTCAEWHALAKLRLHTDTTLDIMDLSTVRLGRELRSFAKTTCSAFATKELKREVAARQRRQARAAVASSSKRCIGPAVIAQGGTQKDTQPNGPLLKTFNLNTVKIHFLGDHADTIREFGTNDSHSTEPGELEHRTPKSRYPRTGRKFYVRQLANIDSRMTRLRRIRERTGAAKLAFENVPASPDHHHHIGVSENLSIHTGEFIRAGAGDPAMEVMKHRTFK